MFKFHNRKLSCDMQKRPFKLACFQCQRWNVIKLEMCVGCFKQIIFYFQICRYFLLQSLVCPPHVLTSSNFSFVPVFVQILPAFWLKPERFGFILNILSRTEFLSNNAVRKECKTTSWKLRFVYKILVLVS